MLTSIILVLITLIAGIIGTIFNPTPRLKAVIIVLAIGSAIATLANRYDDFREQQFNRGALAALLTTSTPTPEFQRVVESAVARVARQHDLIQSFTIVKDTGTIYGFHRNGALSDDVIAVFAMTNEDRAAAFLKYISNESLDPVVTSSMFTPEPQQLGDAWDIKTKLLLDHLGLIGNVSLNRKIPWIRRDTDIITDISYNPLRVEVTADDGKRQSAVALEKDFILAIRGLPPVERDGKAYVAFIGQIK